MQLLKKCGILFMCLMFLFVALPAPLYAAPVIALSDGDSAQNIQEEELPYTRPKQTWALYSLFAAVAAIGIAVCTGLAMMKRHNNVAHKAFVVLLGGLVGLLYFGTNNMAGNMARVNVTTMPMLIIVFVECVMVLISMRPPAKAKE